MKFVHTMIRVDNLEEALEFWCRKIGLVEMRRNDYPQGKFTLVFLAAPDDVEQATTDHTGELELTYNWERHEKYETGRSWGHLAYRVDNIYETCQRLMDNGVTINRPPRDGRMAFVKSPENVSIEFLQNGEALETQEPWVSMPNTGAW